MESKDKTKKPEVNERPTGFEVVIGRISDGLSYLTFATFAIMAILVTADVAMRTVAKPIPGVTEFTQSLLFDS